MVSMAFALVVMPVERVIECKQGAVGLVEVGLYRVDRVYIERKVQPSDGRNRDSKKVIKIV